MKEDMRSWFQRLGYEEGFGPGEVFPFEVRRRKSDTYEIVSSASRTKRKVIFDEDEVSLLVF